MYKSIYGESEASFTEQKSEFIAHIAHVESEDDAIGFVDRVRSENRKAKHNCYAYSVRDGNLMRYSDDAEPQGTAGPPIMDVIQKNGLTDVAVVVTRYFGGILLGKGGLTRAYSKAAAMAVESARMMELCPAYKVSVAASYSYYDRIVYSLPEFDVRITDTVYSDAVSIILAVRKESFEALSKKLRDITNGEVDVVRSDEILFDFAQ